MAIDRLFVGREAELARFREALEDPSGKAILITGPERMGKTFLARRMLEEVGEGRHPTLTCGAVSYQVTVTDPPEQVMERMIEDAFSAGDAEGSLSASPYRRRQWRTLFKAVVPKGKDLLDLADSLRRERTRPARERLVDLLEKLSDALPEDRRVLFLVDADKHLPAGSDEPWSWVIHHLPPKIVLLFTQCPDDALAGSAAIDHLDQVVRIPEGDLGRLSQDAVDELLRLVPADLGHPFDDLRAHFERLEGHPYAVGAALDLLIEGVPLDRFPVDPGGIAAERKRRDEDRLGPLLTTGAADLPPDPPPSKLLTARYEVVPFEEVGREGELAILDAWCRDPEPGSVLLIHGEGGTGKTRLLIEGCRRLREQGWHAGFLDRDVERSQIEPLYKGEAPRLAVIDYGETRPDLVAPALHRLTRQRETAGPKVRIVLLARNADSWWRQLQEDDRLIEDLALRSPSPIALTPLIPAIEDRPATVARAAVAFAAFHGQDPREPAEEADYADPRYDRVLYLHVDALLQVIGEDDQDDPPLARILSRERATWRRALVSHGITTDPVPDRLRRAADRAMTAVSLVRGVANREDACKLIQAAVPGDQGDLVEDLADLFHGLYPSPAGSDPRWIAPVEPDLLREELAGQVLTANANFLDPLLDAIDERKAFNALIVLSQVFAHRTMPFPLARSVEHQTSVVSDLPDSLREVAVAACRRVLETLREDRPGLDQNVCAERARLLTNLSRHLASLGRVDEALTAAEQSVNFYRGLAAERPEPYCAALGTSLNNLSACLADLGRWDEALATSAEAVEVRAQVGSGCTIVQVSDLASSFNNFSVFLAENGLLRESLPVAETAVDLFRRLAALVPGRFREPLAASLQTLGNRRAALGLSEEAVVAAEESVFILRGLVRTRPRGSRAKLAGSLNDLSLHLREVDRLGEALETVKEAVRIRRKMATERPEVYLGDLAMSLHNFNLHLGALNRHEEALAVAEEASNIYRKLARRRPGTFEPSLAMSLANMSVNLECLGSLQEGLTAANEAVRTLAPHFFRNPRAFAPRLETVLGVLEAQCKEAGRVPDEDLVRPIREALADLDDESSSDA